MAVNVEQWAKEYYDSVDGPGLTGINLSQVRVKVKDVKWVSSEPATVSQGPTRQVTVRNKNGQPDVFGNLQTTKESVMIANINITKGIVKGLNKTMRLPLPPEVKSSLGETVEIDPSKAQSEKKDVMTISVTSGHDIGGAATASVSCKEGEYQGRFSCTVALSGPVIFQEQGNSTSQIEVAGIAQGDQEVRVQRQEVLFPMEGHCVFRWDFEQNIDWN